MAAVGDDSAVASGFSVTMSDDEGSTAASGRTSEAAEAVAAGLALVTFALDDKDSGDGSETGGSSPPEWEDMGCGSVLASPPAEDNAPAPFSCTRGVVVDWREASTSEVVGVIGAPIVDSDVASPSAREGACCRRVWCSWKATLPPGTTFQYGLGPSPLLSGRWLTGASVESRAAGVP